MRFQPCRQTAQRVPSGAAPAPTNSRQGCGRRRSRVALIIGPKVRKFLSERGGAGSGTNAHTAAACPAATGHRGNCGHWMDCDRRAQMHVPARYRIAHFLLTMQQGRLRQFLANPIVAWNCADVRPHVHSESLASLESYRISEHRVCVRGHEHSSSLSRRLIGVGPAGAPRTGRRGPAARLLVTAGPLVGSSVSAARRREYLFWFSGHAWSHSRSAAMSGQPRQQWIGLRTALSAALGAPKELPHICAERRALPPARVGGGATRIQRLGEEGYWESKGIGRGRRLGEEGDRERKEVWARSAVSLKNWRVQKRERWT
eukprot:gene13197-biopygen5691